MSDKCKEKVDGGSESRFCSFNKCGPVVSGKGKTHWSHSWPLSLTSSDLSAILSQTCPKYVQDITTSQHLYLCYPDAKTFAVTAVVDFIIIPTFHYPFLWDQLIIGMAMCFGVKYVWKWHGHLLSSLQEPWCDSAISLFLLPWAQWYHRLGLFFLCGL